MTLWLLISLMTALAIFAVLWPLSRRGQDLSGGSDVAVYRDQLDEVERDRASGLIPEAEAEAARIEVSRRILQANDAEPDPQSAGPRAADWRRRATAIAALVLLPAGVAAFYLVVGSPHLPGQPLAERRASPPANASLASMVAQVEAHLANNPNDARGWEVIAPVYLRMGRYDDAVRARRNALKFGEETAARQADFGEAMVAAAHGVVTADAKQAFERALTFDPKDVKARYFLGLAAEQDGRKQDAATIWRALLKDAPPNAPWVRQVRAALVRIAAEGPIAGKAGPSAEEVEAASNLTASQRNQMVRGMVARLAERLKTDGNDVDGWLHLVRAYMVLGDKDQARAALTDARRALHDQPEKLRRLKTLAEGLGLNG